MTDPGKSNHWDLLASELGTGPHVEASKDKPEPAGEQPEVGPETTAAEPIPAKTPLDEPAAESRRPIPDWDALASQLGIVPEEKPTEPPPEETPLKDPAKVVEEPSHVIEEPTDVIEETAYPIEAPSDVRRQAVDVVEATGEAAKKKPASRRRKRRRKTREPDEAVAGRCDSESAAELSDAVSDEPIVVDKLEADDAEPGKGRAKRKRHRRSPSRKGKKSTEPDEAPGEEDFTLDEAETDTMKSTRSAGRPKKPSTQQSGEQKPARGFKTAKAGHRTIPTWEEAIGLIVSANLEARSKSPNGGSPRGRRGAKEGRASNRERESKESRGSGKKSSKRKG